MRSRIFLLAIIVLMALTLPGCSWLFGRHGFFRDRGDDYMKSTEMPPMQVPANLSASAITELLVIPPISNEYLDADKEFEAPRPHLVTGNTAIEVKIQKLDARRWIVINNPPNVVWARVKHFLDEKQFALAEVDAVMGLMETDWLKLDNEPDTKDRYRLKLEQGIHPNTTEIHVTQITVAASVPGTGSVNWPANSMNPDREKWMLDQLSNYLAVDDKVSYSLLAQAIAGAKKIEIIQPYQGEGFLNASMDMDRTWASVAGALNKSPFEIRDLDRSRGLFQVAYDPEPPKPDAEPPGFFSHLFGFDKRAQEEHERNKIPYHVLLEEKGQNEVRIYIKTDQDAALPAKDSEKLLSLIRNHLD